MMFKFQDTLNSRSRFVVLYVITDLSWLPPTGVNVNQNVVRWMKPMWLCNS